MSALLATSMSLTATTITSFATDSKVQTIQQKETTAVSEVAHLDIWDPIALPVGATEDLGMIDELDSNYEHIRYKSISADMIPGYDSQKIGKTFYAFPYKGLGAGIYINIRPLYIKIDDQTISLNGKLSHGLEIKFIDKETNKVYYSYGLTRAYFKELEDSIDTSKPGVQNIKITSHEYGVVLEGNMKVTIKGNDQWIKSGSRWWYKHENGSCTKNNFELIDGEWYYFDNNGYMVTGWQKVGNTWYYLKDSGIMAKNEWIGDYFFLNSGAMATNRWIAEYYVGADGKYRPAQWMQTANGKWWYKHSDGSYTKDNFELIDGKWYYFNSSGYMSTGWRRVGNTWYYFESSGIMASNKWVNDCFLEDSGAMATNKWVGNYYVGADGVYQPAKWIQTNGKWWYKHQDGSYTKNNFELINGKWYFFDGNGYMVTGWKQVANTWYYFYSSGVMASNQWVGDYYFEANGALATNKWIGNSYVGADGKWIPNYK